MEQLALQQQIELLQQQQQQIAATHQQYVNMGMIPQQQQLPTVNFPASQGQSSMGNMPQFQFPQQQQQQQQQSLGVPIAPPTQPSSHRRNQSALPNMSMGPPPAPSSGAAGSSFEYGQTNNNAGSDVVATKGDIHWPCPRLRRLLSLRSRRERRPDFSFLFLEPAGRLLRRHIALLAPPRVKTKVHQVSNPLPQEA